MSLPTREQELWALAFSVEREHGEEGSRVIAETIGAFALAGEASAVDLWKEVARRYSRLISRADGCFE